MESIEQTKKAQATEEAAKLEDQLKKQTLEDGEDDGEDDDETANADGVAGDQVNRSCILRESHTRLTQEDIDLF